MSRRLMQLAPAVLLAACTIVDTPLEDGPRTEIQFLAPADSWPFPFSPAVRFGNLLFLSGQIGTHAVDGAPALVTGGIEAETHQTMRNIQAILESNGTSLQRVVRCLVMLTDMSEWPRMNAIYASYFPGPKPARSAVGASALALGARVEIECTAAY